MFFVHLDRGVEGGLWRDFPAIPVSFPLLSWCWVGLYGTVLMVDRLQ